VQEHIGRKKFTIIFKQNSAASEILYYKMKCTIFVLTICGTCTHQSIQIFISFYHSVGRPGSTTHPDPGSEIIQQIHTVQIRFSTGGGGSHHRYKDSNTVD